MSDRDESQRKLFELLYPTAAGLATPSDDVKMVRFALLIVLCTHANVFAKTFPDDGGVNPQAVYDTGWFTRAEVPPDVIQRLLGSRALLADVQRAWYKLADEYEDPPCPREEKFARLVQYVKTQL